MDKQLSIAPRGELFHLHFHNYQGPFEGHQIGSFLELEEIEGPSSADEPVEMKPGQYYLWRPMDFNPDLYALVDADKLDDVARIVKHMHMTVLEGREWLPGSDLPEVTDPDENAGPPEHHSYVEDFEKRHESVLHKGPRAIVSAFLFRAIPLGIVILLVVIAGRHVGDHHRSLPIDAVFAQATRAPVPQNLFERIWQPDHSSKVRVEFRAVHFLDRNRMILADGSYLVFHGAGDLLPVFRKAQELVSVPVLDATIVDGKIMVDKLVCGGETMLRSGRVERLAKFSPCAPEPPVGRPGNETVFQRYGTIDFDDTAHLEALLGQRLALEGRIVGRDGQRVLQFEDGGGVILEPRKAGSLADQLLEALEGGKPSIRVNVVLRSVLPWKDEKRPELSRERTQLAGLADVYSISAQNYHLVERP